MLFRSTGLSAGGSPVVSGSPLMLSSRSVPIPTLLLMILAAVLALCAVMLPPIIARHRAAAAVPAVGPKKTTTQVVLEKPARRLAIPKIHLPARFRKADSAEAPKEDS